MYVNILNNKGFKWHIKKSCKYKHALSDKELDKLEKLCDYLNNVTENKEIDRKIVQEALADINGSFALIYESNEYLFAATDRLRSIPIFYSLDQENNVNGIFDTLILLDTDEEDPLAWEEIGYTGYTFNEKTLIHNFYQLLPGQYVICNKTSKNYEIVYYFRHLRQSNNLALEFEEEFDRLDSITDNFITELINSAKGKKLVIPLSGGYDSRYIVAALFRYNYTNMICYSYGQPRSYEITNARKIAETLGLDFIEIHYQDSDWEKLLYSDDFKQYCQYASNAASLPHIQEFIALKYLKDNSLIPNDSVIVPGFCGDLLGGSYLPKDYIETGDNEVMQEALDDYIIRNHLVNKKTEIDIYHRMLIQSSIRSYIRNTGVSVCNIDDFISLNECWFTEHKVAKFVVNALRVYEFYGYEWRMPLWDNELMEYWYRVPNSYRIDNSMYNKFLFDRLFIPLKIDMPKRLPVSRNASIIALKKLVPERIFTTAGLIYRNVKNIFTVEDINKFDVLSREILRKIGVRSDEYANVNGVFAEWLRTQNTLRLDKTHTRRVQ